MLKAKKATLLKYTLGTIAAPLLLLAFYNVSALPTDNPPLADNAPPITKSNVNQVKEGGLENVASLLVEGGMQVGREADVDGGSIPCDASRGGQLLFDTGDNILFLCNGTTWQAL